MKLASLTIMTVALSAFTFACSSVADRSTTELASADEAATPFSCSFYDPAAADGYGYRIEVGNDLLSVLQSSINGRFMPLYYTIAQNDKLEIPTATPEFSCNRTDESREDRYSVTIKVYEKHLVVLQSAINVRFAPLKYDITRRESIEATK